MSRVHYSFDSAVAATQAGEAHLERAPRRVKLRSRAQLRDLVENLGLFAFGFGVTNLLIHFAVGYLYALRMSNAFPQLTL